MTTKPTAAAILSLDTAERNQAIIAAFADGVSIPVRKGSEWRVIIEITGEVDGAPEGLTVYQHDDGDLLISETSNVSHIWGVVVDPA